MELYPFTLHDQRLDKGLLDDQELFTTVALRNQIRFAWNQVPFWHRRFIEYEVDPEKINSLTDFARLPPLSKEELRRLSPWEFVPQSSRAHLYICRSTSGTTGSPTSSFWTRPDWRAMSETVARLLQLHRPVIDIVSFNGYHQGHAAALAYDDAIRLLGGICIPRHYLADDEASTLAQIQTFGCNTLILAQRSGLKKSGRTVEDMLRYQPDFFSQCKLRWWLGSSSPFTKEVCEIANQQGVISTTNFYGSSELGFLGVSCQNNPDEFHLLLGHVFVEVVDQEGFPVSSGQRGRIVATRLVASHADNGLGPHEGSQFLRLDNQDEAMFLNGKCACGLSSPRIRDICRR
jgi:phenylacetate-CoA ligase